MAATGPQHLPRSAESSAHPGQPDSPSAPPVPAAPDDRPGRRIDLFCRVVDNYGDIGVCWRLARQLAAEHGARVVLFVDVLESFRRLCPAIDPALAVQSFCGVEIRRWANDGDAADLAGATVDFVADTVDANGFPDVVIEAFGCNLPDTVIASMAARKRRRRDGKQPAWINLEYLSAETWVDDCHAQVSHYPSLPLLKHFFFPGFTGATGGLPMEADLIARRDAFQASDRARAEFLRRLGVTPPAASSGGATMSLFCYPDAPLASLFDTLAAAPRPTLCLVPEGVAGEQVGRFLGAAPAPGRSRRHGGLTLQVIPFLEQTDYDRLLWSCDMNLVRGEDSLVRAIWAGRALLWDCYAQAEDGHLVKLAALLARLSPFLPPSLAGAVAASWMAWNRREPMAPHAGVLPGVGAAALAPLGAATGRFGAGLRRNGDLAANLIGFLDKIG